MNQKKIKLLYLDLFKTRIIKGNTILFILSRLCFYSTYSSFMHNIFFNKWNDIISYIITKFPSKKYIIKNDIGKFVFSLNNDTNIKSSLIFENLNRKLFFKDNNKIFIDIGANIGFFSILAIKEHYEKIYSIEANKNTFKYLKKNVELNQSKKNEIFNYGIGEKEEEAYITNNTFHTGGNEINFNKKGVKTKIISLDKFIKKQNIKIDDIGFIKIDIEGYEVKAIKGMQNTLKNMDKNTYILIESFNKNYKIIEKEMMKNNFKVIDNIGQNYLFKKLNNL